MRARALLTLGVATVFARRAGRSCGHVRQQPSGPDQGTNEAWPGGERRAERGDLVHFWLRVWPTVSRSPDLCLGPKDLGLQNDPPAIPARTSMCRIVPQFISSRRLIRRRTSSLTTKSARLTSGRGDSSVSPSPHSPLNRRQFLEREASAAAGGFVHSLLTPAWTGNVRDSAGHSAATHFGFTQHDSASDTGSR